MRWDIRVTNHYYGAATCFAVCVMAAPLVFHLEGLIASALFCVSLVGAIGFTTAGFLVSIRGEKAASVQGHSRRMVSLYGMVTSGVCFIAFAGLYFWPGRNVGDTSEPSSIVPTFDVSGVPEIGKPAALAIASRYGYQAAHDHAWVLWVGRELYFLPLDSTKSWVVQHDPEWNLDERLYDDAKGRALFRTPRDKFPPYGGVGNLWMSDPGKWQWIGWRKWHCSIDDYQITSQAFTGGTVFGVYRSNVVQNDGQLFLLFNNGTWRSIPNRQNASTCKPPAPFPVAAPSADSARPAGRMPQHYP